MPYRVYNDLELGPLAKTDIVVQLADGTSITLRGIVENVLVQIEQLVFPADFFVLDMHDSEVKGHAMLGMPFLIISRTKIDYFSGVLTMEFDKKVVGHRTGEEGSVFIPNASSIEIRKDSII